MGTLKPQSRSKLSPGPFFKFGFNYIQWYDEDAGKSRFASYSFEDKIWYDENEKPIVAIYNIRKGATLYVGWIIRNEGDQAGNNAVFRVDDKYSDEEVCLYRKLYDRELDIGDEWNDSGSFTMPDRNIKIVLRSCQYSSSDNMDYIHQETGSLNIWLYREKPCEIRDLVVKDPQGNNVTTLYTGTTYTIQCVLGEVTDGFAYIPGATVKFYLDGKYLDSDRTRVDPLGYAIINYTPVSDDVGDKTLKAVHEADGTYGYCEREINVTVRAPTPTPTPTSNYDIILPVGYCLWGFDWIASNFVTKILPAVTNALTGVDAGIVVHGDKSYYDSVNKQIVINADIPTESPIPPIIIYLIIVGVSVALTLLGVWIHDTFFSKKGETEQLSTFITPVDQYHEPINEKVTFTLSTGDVASTNPPEEYSAQFTLTKGTVFSITKIESEHYTGDPEGAWKDPHEAGDRVEVVLYPKDLVDVDVTVVDKDTHEPVEGVYVVLSDSYNRVIKYGTTNASGIAHITDVPKAKYTVGAYTAEHSKIKAGEDFIDTRTQTAITLEIAVELRLSKLVYEKGTLVGIENVNVELIEASTNTVKDSGTTNEAGFVRLSIKPEDAGLYRLRLTKRNYNNNEPLLSDPFEFTESCSKVNYMELTERVSTVRILPLTEDNKTLPGAAHVTLEGFEEKTTGTDGSVTYKEVPYGEYKITVIAKDYEQVEPDKRYVVDEKLENFQPRMRSVLPPSPITIECKVKDEKGEPIPNALIDVDSQKLIRRHEYPMSDAYVDVGSVSMVEFKGDGANVVTDDKGYCKFHLPAIGTEGIKGYYLRAGKPGYYNEKGKEDWTESTAMITESPTQPVEFTLSSPAPSIVECLFPRIYTRKPFPRIAQANPIPRITCIVTAIGKMWKRERPWWW